jgi:Rho GTPase-activating protein RGD1
VPQLPEVDTHGDRGDIAKDVQRVSLGGHTQLSASPLDIQLNSLYQPPVARPSTSGQPTNSWPTTQHSGLASSAHIPSSQPLSYPHATEPPKAYNLPLNQSLVYPPETQALLDTSSPNLSAPTSSIQATPSPAFVPLPSFTPTPPPEKVSPLQTSQPRTLAPSNVNILDSQLSSRKGATFGVSLDDVLNRENAVLPLIVAQCVLAVDEFGLRTEGIYRVSGSATTLAKLKDLFDFEPDHIDFRTPAGFFGDIHAVAGILKQYLRELPEPVLTRAYYHDFIRVARRIP